MFYLFMCTPTIASLTSIQFNSYSETINSLVFTNMHARGILQEYNFFHTTKNQSSNDPPKSILATQDFNKTKLPNIIVTNTDTNTKPATKKSTYLQARSQQTKHQKLHPNWLTSIIPIVFFFFFFLLLLLNNTHTSDQNQRLVTNLQFFLAKPKYSILKTFGYQPSFLDLINSIKNFMLYQQLFKIFQLEKNA
jgi:hypothetical protein